MIWDKRLGKRGAQYIPYRGAPGDEYWQLSEAHWMDERESQGKHLVYVDAIDGGKRAVGARILFSWKDSGTVKHIEAKPGEPYGQSIPMYEVGCAYTLSMDGLSDAIGCLGLGTLEHPDAKAHTSYAFIFRRAIYGDAEGPVPEPVPGNAEDWQTVLEIATQMTEIARRNLR